MEYRVSLSSDFLSLYDVTASYKDGSDVVKTAQIRSKSWSFQVRRDTYDAEIQVTAKAKNGAISGELLNKDSYDMKFTCEILSSEEIRERDGIPSFTKAGDSESNTFIFRVPLGPANSKSISAKVPPFKFNKHFVFSYSVDDSYTNGWSRIYSVINGAWLDSLEFFHKNAIPTTGTKNPPLCVTDGCGNDRRFTFGESIWPSLWNQNFPNGLIQDESVSIYCPYITWEELQIMTDMGNAVYWHDVDNTRFDPKTVEGILAGFEYDYQRTLDKIGYPMRTLGLPNGDKTYLEAGQKCPLVKLIRITFSGHEFDLLGTDNLYKAELFGGDSPGSVEEKLAELARESESARPKLVSMFSHRPNEPDVEMFREIARRYGKDGKDNIWVTSYDELYDYYNLRREAKINESVKDGYKYFEVTIPNSSSALYKELSFVIEGATAAAEPVSDNLYGFSSAVQSDGSVLVNCSFDPKTQTLAEKYVRSYETYFNSEDKECAEYLISLLRADLRKPLLDRVAKVHEPTEEDVPYNGTYSKIEMKYYVKLYPELEQKVSRSW